MSKERIAEKLKELEQRLARIETQRSSGGMLARRLMSGSDERYPTLKKTRDEWRRRTLQKTAGALKAKLPKDLPAWQRKQRAAW